MGRRGRRPHNGLLTEREHEVLDLIRLGLSNAEIADRMSIARETVKWHVSEILSKLGVETREAAAAWQPEELVGGRPLRLGGMPLLFRLAGAGLVAATVAGVAVFGWAVVQTSGGDGDQAIAATASSQPEQLVSERGNSTPTPNGTPAPPGSGGPQTPTPKAISIGAVAPSPLRPPTPTPQHSFDNRPNEGGTPIPGSHTPTPTPTPPPPPQSTEHDVVPTLTPQILTPTPIVYPTIPDRGPPPTPTPRCVDDWDCDGWPDEVEQQYGSQAYWEYSTPENADFDVAYGQSTCSDGYDNDRDNWTDGTDGGCGGSESPTPTPQFTPTARPSTPTPPPWSPEPPTPTFSPFPLPT
jgi:DNA-binding CsgD family transcriptional regulator